MKVQGGYMAESDGPRPPVPNTGSGVKPPGFDPYYIIQVLEGALKVCDVRISGLSRAVDELFQVKRSEAILAVAAKNLLDDVRRRHPGEDLRCPLMIALDAAMNQRHARDL